MPKKLNSVSLNSNCLKLIESYCAKEDISEAAFSRKFEKNNRWVADLRRGRSMNLPSYDAAAQMCVLLQTTPDEILLHQGETEEETAKCQKDIALVRDLLDQQRTKKAPTETSERDELCPTAERIVDILKVAPQAELDKILGYVEFLQSKWGEKK